MKKFMVLFLFWWAIIFPSLNFSSEFNSNNIEFRFMLIDTIKQTRENPTSLHFPS